MKRKLYSIILILALLFTTIPTVAFAADPAPNWKLIQPLYSTVDTFVAAYSVKDFGAAGDGVTDVTATFQSLLDSLGRLGGGTLFVPQGKYVIRGTLLIPKGVTMRGEWKTPVKGQAITGTILMAYSGRGDENATPFITMEPSAGVRDLSIWYPEQLPGSITAYPPSIVFGKPNYFGNEFCNAKNITLVNSYTGLVFSRLNGGTCPVINGLYGTPLSRGIEIDNIVDVGRIDWVDFSPSYWSGSGLANAPAAGSSFENWIYQNGTGIVMRRNDWSYTCFVNIEGYNKGFHAAPSVTTPGAVPNGHHYSMNFNKCKTGIYFEGVCGDGTLYSKITTTNCDTGIAIGPNTSGAAQFDGCSFDANTNAIYTDVTSSSKLMMQQCTIARGQVNIVGGTLSVSDSDFNNNAPQITLGANSRGIITGNRFRVAAQIQDNSNYVSTVDHTAMTVKKLPSFPTITTETHKPTRMVMYNAANSPFNAKNDGVTDNTSAIQSALNQAAADGGGIVFLPPGKYKVLGNLTIPTGVELKGSVDNSTTPTGPGSILEVYAGRGNASAAPFMKVSAGAGVRGIVFNYPEQISTQLPNIAVYPYTIQVTGSNAYIINVGMRAVYNGIDLFTYKTDNHYVDFVAGHAFKTGIRVGGNSTGGKIYNLQFNVIAYACGSESKFGSWPNSPAEGNSAAYEYSFNNFDFMILGACQNETLYNDFGYGMQRGIVLASDNGTGPTGLSLGLGIDGARRSMCYEATGTGGFDFINSQIVSFGDTTTRYIETSSGFTGQSTLFNTDYWGATGTSIVMGNGNINLQLSHFHQPGQMAFASLNGGSLNIVNSAVYPINQLLNSGGEPRLSVQSSIIDPSGINKNNCALWKNNQGNSAAASTAGALDRTGWTAAASNNPGAVGNALDGNVTTRWDTAGSQASGQWFTVDMKSAKTFNKVILDSSPSPDDSPVAYSLYVSNDGTNWGSALASGAGNAGMTVIIFPQTTARYIKVTQNGSKGNYWSIHEITAHNSTTQTTAPIPGLIEAENYSAMSGIQTESCSEGTQDVGWTDTGDWMNYNVNVAAAGTYTVEYRIASPNATGQIQLKNGSTVLATTAIPNTTGWQTWQTVTAAVNLNAGSQTLTAYVSAGGFNVNWINFKSGGSGGQVATPTFTPASGTYTSAQSVTITCATSGATIKYTTDGSTPTASSATYTGPINVAATTTVKAIAIKSGMTDSAVASAAYTINIPQGQPDLVVTDITWSPASPAAGNAVTFSATIKNQGTGASPAGVINGVGFQIDGAATSLWSDNNTSSIPAGSSITVTVSGGTAGSTWTAAAGTHSISAWVDDVNRITESNESNNQFTKSITVGSGSGNLAQGKSITASSYNQTYVAANANDGSVNTYWEGAAYPAAITVDLGSAQTVGKVVLKLNASWGSRTQTLSVLSSTDNATYTTRSASTTYTFNPTSSNTVTITFTPTTARYVRLNFTANSGAVSGQVAEYEVYSN